MVFSRSSSVMEEVLVSISICIGVLFPKGPGIFRWMYPQWFGSLIKFTFIPSRVNMLR